MRDLRVSETCGKQKCPAVLRVNRDHEVPDAQLSCRVLTHAGHRETVAALVGQDVDMGTTLVPLRWEVTDNHTSDGAVVTHGHQKNRPSLGVTLKNVVER